MASQRDDIRSVLIEMFAVSDAMNQLLLAHLDGRTWRAQLPTVKKNDGRTIASIFAHLHNARLLWLKHNAPYLKVPPPLDVRRCTMRQTTSALKRSAAQCVRMLRDALGQERKITKFSRGSWTRTWPAGGTMFAYMFAHEAHHRGQILMLAHQLGYRLPADVMGGIWQWDTLWKQQGFKTRPR
ncbi:MAG TPA: DinB family protein [Terracidiphilus sp.]|jgi:uncharacterized damage-inducible protein DinB|nr:DinB family protein [Terracidiphilus sp.]